MDNIVKAWKQTSEHFNAEEREKEREWAWIFTRFSISDVLEDPGNVRSMASHWGRATQTIDPATFLLRGLPEMAELFLEYLEAKSKTFPRSDIACFIAWKFWEAKIYSDNIFAPEINTMAVAWQKGKVEYAGVFEALNHCIKQRRDDVAKLIANHLYSAFDEKDPEEKQRILAEIKKEIAPVLKTDNSQLLEDFKNEYLAKKDARLTSKMPKHLSADTTPEQINGEEE